MAHEILSVKLCQLDDRVGKLHTRIRMSETASPSQLKQEINMLKQECREGEMSLHDTLKRSKSTMVSILAGSYEQMEQIIQNAKEQLACMIGPMISDNPLTAIFGYSDADIRMNLMELVKPGTIILHFPAVPSEIVIIAFHIGNSMHRAFDRSHGHMSNRRQTGRIQLF